MAEKKLKSFLVNGVRAVERHGKPTFDLRLTDPEMQDEVKALKKKLESDADFRQTLLHKAGIVTASGRVAKKYAGVF